MVTRLAILGSTGSIGTQTLDVVRRFPDRLAVVGLAAGHTTPLFTRQVAEFMPRFAFTSDGFDVPGCQFLNLEEMASHPEADIVVIAISGGAAIASVMAAASTGKVIAIANKESIVSAGKLIFAAAAQTGAVLRPVDSEHSAIWQCLAGENTSPTRLILTASGGPFRNYSQADLAAVSVQEALKHPSWQMGPKVTIDSATLLNKGLEVIEAHHLFHLPYDKIEVVVHPQSIVHALVEFGDGALKAQLATPDMRLSIQYALSYPERWENNTWRQLDLAQIKCLDFEPPDHSRFPCLTLALEAGGKGGTYPAALCAAGESAVEFFLAGRIKFIDIAPVIKSTLDTHPSTANPALSDILAACRWAKNAVREIVEKESRYC